MVHTFSDDTQMYLHCSRDDTTSVADRLERCIADVGQWLSANHLKLNTDKTALLWVRTRHSLSQHGPFPVLQLGLDLITSSDYVRLLGAMITFGLNLDRHVSCRQCIMFLLAMTTSAYLAFAEPGVSSDTCARVCYTLLAGAPKVMTDKLQRVLNAAARILTRTHKFDRACRGCCTGSSYLSESHTRSESSCSAASMVELHSIWSITVYRSPMWCHGSTSVQPVVIFCSYCVTVSACMAAWLLPSLARRPGTLSRIISGIWTLLQTTSSACWKRFCSQRTSAISALDVLRW